MAIEQRTIIDKIEFFAPTGEIRVRRSTQFVDGDRVLGEGPPHRASYIPGMDISAEDPRVQQFAKMAWFPEVGQALDTFLEADAETQALWRALLKLPPSKASEALAVLASAAVPEKG